MVTIRGRLLLMMIRPGTQVKRRWPAPRRMIFVLCTLLGDDVAAADVDALDDLVWCLPLTSLLELLVTPLRSNCCASALQRVSRLLSVFPLLLL